MAEEKTGTTEVKEAKKEGSVAAPAANGTEALFKRLIAMEQLMKEQAETSKKIARSRRWTVVLLSCLVVVLAIGVAAMAIALQSLPQVMTSANQALKEIGSIDMGALNGAIKEMEESLVAVDFRTLNESIQNLHQVVQELMEFTSLFN